MKTIVLTGMPGAGKSAVAKKLSEYLKISVVDIDEEIEKLQGTTISKIFDEKGEFYFREIEQTVIHNLFRSENIIISLGGGAFEDNTTRLFLLENSLVVYLETSPEVIYSRIKNSTQRPLLTNSMSVEKITKILEIRNSNYKKAHIIVNTDSRSITEVVAMILKELNK